MQTINTRKNMETVSPNIFVTDLKQTTEIIKFFDQIKDNVKVVKGLEKTFHGATEFSIKDNNGYLLTFAEDEK
jgi:uncharacterized glyoxalase superfamily protein PhnB